MSQIDVTSEASGTPTADATVDVTARRRKSHFENKVEIIEPLGTGKVFKAPDHGVLRVKLNDDDFNGNTWKVEAGLQHHASVGYSPK